jgi:predicted nucleotidyltransferase
MDKREALNIAQKYILSVNRKFHIEKAYLFGSFAKGTQHRDSDIDLAIVFQHVDDIVEMQILLLQLRTDEDLLIEPHPFLQSDFNFSNPMVAEILRNGIELSGKVA